MTTVTKIFVVLVCLFAFIFTPLAISFAARTHNWRAHAERLQDVAETALAHERSTIGTAASTIEHYKARYEQERQRAENTEQQFVDLQQQMASTTAQLAEAQRSRDSWENSARTLSARMEVIDNNNTQLVEDNQRLTQNEQELQSQLGQCEDDLADMSANNVILARYLKQRKEELAALRAEYDALRETTRFGKGSEALLSPPAESAQAVGPGARPAIRGQVVQVKANEGLASINVGLTSGLQQGMRMVVVRDGKYICDLVMTDDINDTSAVGRIDNPGGNQILEGDPVIDAYSLGSP